MRTQHVERDTLRLSKTRTQETIRRRGRSRTGAWPPVPDLFDVITFFRARGDSFTLIASIGFWIGEDRKKALTARRVALSWYESELERRAAAAAAIR
jgi:hypothetical protein